MTEVKTGRGYVYMIPYHIVWCVKYRRKVLTSEIKPYLFQVLEEIAAEGGYKITEINGEEDQVHLLIECTPQHDIPDMIKGLKGVSARRIFKQYPGMKSKLWGGHLWNPSYFVATVSENKEEQIRNYIQRQKIK